MEILLLCLGNALRRDDAIALRAADLLEAAPPPGAIVRRTAASGLYLLDEMEGFDRVVVVDAVRTGRHRPGAVLAFPLEDLRAPEGPSPHSIGLPSALARARAAGAPVPSRIEVVAVEVLDMETIGEGLTPEVEAAVPAAAAAARRAVAALRRPRREHPGCAGQPAPASSGVMRAEGTPGIADRRRTVPECLDHPAHAGPLEGAVRVGEASGGGRVVRIGLFAGGLARFRATSCASLIAYAEVACEAIEGGRQAEAADPEALRALVSGVHASHLERAALVAAAVRAALAAEEP